MVKYIYTYPNQKIVMTKKTLSDDTHVYGICNVDATLSAAQELTDRTFKLYLRMSLHQDGFRYALSPAEISNSIGMSAKKYRESVKELISKKYLVPSEEQKNLYVFYEDPRSSADIEDTDHKIKVTVKVSVS